MDIEKLVRLIREFLREQAKPPDARPPEEEFRKGVQELLANFERRALEVDGDQAPRGLDAVQERYYTGLNPPRPELMPESIENLRRLIKPYL